METYKLRFELAHTEHISWYDDIDSKYIEKISLKSPNTNARAI